MDGAAGQARLGPPTRARVGQPVGPTWYWRPLAGSAAGLLVLVQIARHAMWRDELNAWAIALASPTPAALFRNLHYDGHPGLWHLILWVASTVTRNPAALQLVHGAVALALIGFIAWRSPIGPAGTILLLASYFVLFEYTVVSRNYGIAMLIALLYAERRAIRPGGTFGNAALLGLLANTNVFALILSAACALEYLLDRLHAAGPRWRAALPRLAGPAALYLALTALAVATVWPAADMSWRTAGRPLAEALSPYRALFAAAMGAEGLLPLDPPAFWRLGAAAQAAAAEQGTVAWLLLVLTPGVMLALAGSFAGQARLLIIPAVTYAGSIAFGHLIYLGSIRHWGFVFVAFLVALWIRCRRGGRAGYADLGLLAMNAAAGVWMVVLMWSPPFSTAEAAAGFLRTQGLADATLIGTPDTHVAPIAILLGRSMTFPDCDCADRYVRFLRRRETYRPSMLPARLAAEVRRAGDGPVVFVTLRDALDAPRRAAIRAAGVELAPLARFADAVTDETYALYLARAVPVRPGAPRPGEMPR